MVLGTGSGAGKSLVAAVHCRIWSKAGLKVSPFKAQNMALNSFITIDGGEIGRAQGLQAEAAGAVPESDMNPILLKALGETGCQLVMNGRLHSNIKASKYYAFRKNAWKAATAAYDRLASRFDFVFMEGAGSPAEINLLDVDIVNISMAEYAGAGALLVGYIDRGGVYASLCGTIALLGERAYSIKDLCVNKLRGDPAILKPGLDMISDKTGMPMVGVLPHVSTEGLPEEDSLDVMRFNDKREGTS
jgi:adenosylcobyric acid synthase